MDRPKLLEVLPRGANSSPSEEETNMPGVLEKEPWREALNEAVENFKLGGPQVAVLMLDLNYFKDVNDTLGHLEGDRVIADIREMLEGHLRIATNRIDGGDIINIRQTQPDAIPKQSIPEDTQLEIIPGHVGGDEFAVLARTDDKGAMIIRDRLASAFTEYLEKPGNENIKELNISFAVGLSILQPDMSAESLLYLADQDMYANKLAQMRQLNPDEEQRLNEALDTIEGLDIRLRDLGKYALMLGRLSPKKLPE